MTTSEEELRYCHAIIPGILYLGSESAVFEQNWKNILTVKETLPRGFDRIDARFVHIPVRDSPDEPIHIWFPFTSYFLRQCVDKKEKVLVHCQMGISRSATIVIKFLMEYEGLSFVDAQNRVREARPFIRINFGFEQQLLQSEDRKNWLLMEAAAHSYFSQQYENDLVSLLEPIEFHHVAGCIENWCGADIRSIALRGALKNVLCTRLNADEKNKVRAILEELKDDNDLKLDLPLLPSICVDLLTSLNQEG